MRVLRHSWTLGKAWKLVTSHSYAYSLAAGIWLRRSPAEQAVMLGRDILLEGLPDKRQGIEQILLVAHLSCREATSGMVRAAAWISGISRCLELGFTAAISAVMSASVSPLT